MGAIISALILVGASGCQSEIKNSQQSKTTDLPMTVGKYYWPGTFYVEIAQSKGWFKEAGLNVEVIDTNPDYFTSLADVASGKLDVHGFALFDLMMFNLQGSNLVMVINADISSGAEAIVSKPVIKSLKDLIGKTIGVNKGSYLEYILNEALDREGVNKADVNLVDIPYENFLEEFNKESIDAMATWEPFVSEIIENAGGRKLFDTSEIPGLSPNGATFRRSFIDERPGDVQAYVNVWFKATQFIKENPREAFGIIAQNYDLTPGEVQAFTQQDKILDFRENIVAYSFGSGFDSLHGAARKINNFLIENGITDKQMDSTEFIDARFLRFLSENLE